MRTAFIIVLLASAWAHASEPAQLYLALEIKTHGQAVGAPKLLGFTGKTITAERRATASAAPDYQLMLLPVEEGAAYRLALSLTLPAEHHSVDMKLEHAEERTVTEGEVEVKVLLMRVDSEEFRALMRERTQPSSKGTI